MGDWWYDTFGDPSKKGDKGRFGRWTAKTFGNGTNQNRGKFGDWLKNTFEGDNTHPGILGGGMFTPEQSKFDAVPINYDRADQWRGQQGQLAGMLMNQAQGNGPSAAQGLLQQQTQNNIANQYAMAQARPNDVGAARNLANQAGIANQQAAGQGAIMRAQEQQAAQGQLGGMLSGMYGQDLALAAQQASQQQQGNEAAQQLYANNWANQAAANSKVASGVIGAAGTILGGMASNPSLGGAGGGHAMGGLISGYAAHGGDSYANDTVPAMLSPGEVVLPRSIVQAEDAPERAAAFLEAIKRKHRRTA